MVAEPFLFCLFDGVDNPFHSIAAFSRMSKIFVIVLLLLVYQRLYKLTFTFARSLDYYFEIV